MKIISKLLLKLSTLLRRAGKRLDTDKEWSKTMRRWNKLNDEKQFRTNYPELNSKSVVFDLGGYEGQFASNIFSQYLSNIYVFEPHPSFALKIVNRFKKNTQIKVFQYGLGANNEALMMSSNKDSSTIFERSSDSIEIRISEAENFFKVNHIDQVDLMKINIEGGEYELLDHLIDTGRIKKIKNIQVQFHKFVPDAENLMENIHIKLKETHETTYAFKFFWENWKLRE